MKPEILTDQQIIDRGRRAAITLENEEITKCFEEMYNRLHAEIDSMQTDDPEPVMSLTRQLRALRVLRGRLEAWVSEGRIKGMQQ